jgi:N-acetylglutamate synthase-like GNAT family acetyltransferase
MPDKVVTFKLQDGKEVRIRKPTVEADLDRLMHFFVHLPPERKIWLRYNVNNHEILVQRLAEVDGEDHWRLIAELDGQIIADGTMDREAYSWMRHVAELRVIVDRAFQETGVLQALCEELVVLAQEAGVEKLQCMVPVERAKHIQNLEAIGFKQEVVRKGLVKGIDAKLHDVVIMSNDLDEVWRRLEERMQDMDISYSKWSGSV